MINEKEMVLFQTERQFKGLWKDFLILIETRDNYIKDLEKTLVEMGVTHYSQSQVDYQKDRKYILSRGNERLRELNDLIAGFDISFNKNQDEKYNR